MGNLVLRDRREHGKRVVSVLVWVAGQHQTRTARSIFLAATSDNESLALVHQKLAKNTWPFDLINRIRNEDPSVCEVFGTNLVVLRGLAYSTPITNVHANRQVDPEKNPLVALGYVYSLSVARESETGMKQFSGSSVLRMSVPSMCLIIQSLLSVCQSLGLGLQSLWVLDDWDPSFVLALKRVLCKLDDSRNYDNLLGQLLGNSQCTLEFMSELLLTIQHPGCHFVVKSVFAFALIPLRWDALLFLSRLDKTDLNSRVCVACMLQAWIIANELDTLDAGFSWDAGLIALECVRPIPVSRLPGRSGQEDQPSAMMNTCASFLCTTPKLQRFFCEVTPLPGSAECVRAKGKVHVLLLLAEKLQTARALVLQGFQELVETINSFPVLCAVCSTRSASRIAACSRLLGIPFDETKERPPSFCSAHSLPKNVMYVEKTLNTLADDCYGAVDTQCRVADELSNAVQTLKNFHQMLINDLEPPYGATVEVKLANAALGTLGVILSAFPTEG